MAVSSGSRTRVAGFSFLLFCVSLFLTAYSAREPWVARIGSAAIGEILRPFQLLNHWIQNEAGGLWSSYVSLIHVKEENEGLRERLSSLELQNLQLLEVRAENVRLAGLLELKRENQVEGMVATVIGSDPANWTSGLILDRGSSDGIQAGMAVAERGGIVGQVISAGPHSSRVLLITDPSSGVDGLIQETRARGVVEGTGGSRLRWSFVLREDKVELGDRIVTSGMDGIYPKGLLIGVVAEINPKKSGMFQTIEVEPSVDFSRLESVLVISGMNPEILRSAEEGADHQKPEEKGKKKG